MNKLTLIASAFLIASPFYSIPASADHVALVYCEQYWRTDESRVVTFDVPMFAKKPMIGKKGQSCSQTLHELIEAGYEIEDIKVLPYARTGEWKTKETKEWSYISRGEIVFIMRETHKHE